MNKIIVILLFLAVSSFELIKGESSQYSSNIITCLFDNEPWQCARSHASRALDVMDFLLDEKKKELMIEADIELEKTEISRGFSINESTKRSKPSIIMQAVENGIEEIGDFITHTVEDIVTNHQREGKLDSVIPTNKVEPIAEAGHMDEHHNHEHNHENNHGVDHNKENGRSLGELRGKKKKKKKALMKVLLLAAVIKGKIELLLKLLATHLQIKFLGIAALALLINIARFWIDLKKGHAPQKVIYYEHANHQHHYDEHGDDWGGGGGSGSYWKRSIAADQTNKRNDENSGEYENAGYRSLEDLFPNVDTNKQQQEYAHNLAYNQRPPFY